MSSFPTEVTSTTGSSSSSPSLSDSARPREIVTCGALAGHVREIAARRGWQVTVRSLPAVLHNHPKQIITQVASPHADLVAFADCGTYGALDRHNRLPGLHCYDLYAGAEVVRELLEEEPGTYLLTDFLLRSFDKLVIEQLGLDRHPELWDDYFGHYRRMVWLAQHATPDLVAQAARVAARFGLPLRRIDTGTGGLERELERLVEGT